MNNYDEEADGDREYAEKKDKTVREQFRQLAIETLKRKKFAEAKEMMKRKTRIAELQRKQARKAIQKAISSKTSQAAKKLAMQVARQVAMFVLRIIAAIIASFGFYILIALLIIIILVVIIAGINYLCESSWAGQALCSIFL
jgi:preprotein translocase subunit SecF